MAIQINVGLSRKASEDFQSAGVSINLVAELDGSLLNRPDELQSKIAKLYQMAADAVERQMVLTTPLPKRQQTNNWSKGREAPSARSGTNGNGRSPAPMTDRQRKALLAIARQEGVDLYASVRQTFGGIDLDNLSARQASEMIDNLKGNPARN